MCGLGLTPIPITEPVATSKERGEPSNKLDPLPIITLSSTRPLDEEVESITGLQYPARNSLKYYAGSAGVEDPNTNTNTLPDADGLSIEEPILTRPPTPGPSNPRSLIQHFGSYVTELDDSKPFETSMNKPENSDPLPQPTTPSPSAIGNIGYLANLLPSGGSIDKPGSEEWSQGPDSPYESPLEGLNLLGLSLQLTQKEVNKKYQRRFKERYLNSIRELAWWRTLMGKLCKEADAVGEEEVEAIRWYNAHMQATLLFNEDYPDYALPEMPETMTSRLLAGVGGGEAGLAQDPDEGPEPDKGKAPEQ
ncbi:hypothetical protein IW262DRAFT_1301314 [Armillaria fumosa]|nr:hypothetical protein IW262DRAFT_1301314 [Armillaria fumosa]